MDIETSIRDVMAAVFGCLPSEINDAVSTETLSRWDSLRHMNLIVALEDTFGVEFDEDDIVNLLSFRDIVLVIQEKTG